MIMIISTFRKYARYLLVWCCVFALTLSVLALLERQELVREFTNKSATLHRLASQRADQHDAHLTSLSAIFIAGGSERKDLILDVATTISRFYPRIVSVNVIPFDPDEAAIGSRSSFDHITNSLIRELSGQSKGALQIHPMPTKQSNYLLIKRVPNTDAAKHSLALVIDAKALIASEDPFWTKPSVSIELQTPDNDPLTGSLVRGSVEFTKPLGSASQPLVFETYLTIRTRDLLSPEIVVSTIVILTAVFLMMLIGLSQRSRTTEAETRAKLSARETRLAHASRVNAMGEMASGMAHELAQPLTAILSQAQAGRHLVQRSDLVQLRGVIDDTVSQAQRASDILERLRRWSKPNRAPLKACSLNDAVQSVDHLLALEVKTVGASTNLELSSEPISIDADPVELEQIVFNLVRNALDASECPKITIRTVLIDGRAALEVIDDGPGVPNELKQRIFEPFVTGKANGTGLGLALCQRLAEEMDGELELLPDTRLTTFRLSLPLSTGREQA
jgi:signal transduction histidine kinase